MQRVLVVEDDNNARFVLKHIIKKKFRIDVDEAGNGIEGLTKFSETQPDLILLDISMPLMDGKEFLQALRSDNAGKNVPVICLTAMSDRAIVQEMLTLGVKDYILKPFERNDVLERIKTVISRQEESSSVATQKVRKVENFHEKKYLFADKDPEFRNFLASIFRCQLNHFIASNGPECLSLYMKEQPDIIMLGENLPMLNELKIVNKIKEINPENASDIFLCTDNENLPDEIKSAFRGIVPKVENPAAFIKAFTTNVLGFSSISEFIKLTAATLKPELVRVVKGTINKSKNQDIVELESKVLNVIPKEVFAVAESFESAEGLRISLLIYGSEMELSSIAKKTHVFNLAVDEDVLNALTKLVQSIANDLERDLAIKGINTQPFEARSQKDPEALKGFDIQLAVPFQSENWEKFVAAIAVNRPE